MDKKVKSCLIIFILLFLCGCRKENNPEPVEKDLAFSFDTSRVIHLCNDMRCPYDRDITYPLFKINIENYDILDSINEINNKTIEYYDKTLDSKLEKDETCGEFGTGVNYGYIANMDYYQYVDDEIASFGVQREERKLCEGVNTRHIPEIYLYDLVNKRYLTQEEFKKKYTITDQRIMSAIRKHLLKLYPDKLIEEPEVENVSVVLDADKGMLVIFYDKSHGFYTAATLY